MPSLATMPLLGLVILAVGVVGCAVLWRSAALGAGRWARALLRLALALALADVGVVFYRIQPGGVLPLSLWSLGPHLDLTLQVDTPGCAVAVMVLLAALMVSFSGRDQAPLASAALAMAALGGISVAFAGGLLGLFVGLQLSAAGGIGLSYARHPRAASGRMVWAALADQVVGLVWLATSIALLNQWGTVQLSALPTSAVSPGVAALLLLPVAARLGGCLLMGASAGDESAPLGIRALDVADWLAVVAIPTSMVLLIRVQQLAGGQWPASWFGTMLDGGGILAGLAALAVLLSHRDQHSELRTVLLAAAGLVLIGFGQNSASGTLLGLGAGLFLELIATFLPRALLRPTPPLSGVARPRWAAMARGQLIAGGLAALLPISLGFTMAVVGLTVALSAGLSAGIAPGLGYLLALVALALVVPQAWRLVGAPGWDWALGLPALGLVLAAIFPGWVITVLAPVLAAPGTLAQASISAPDPLLVQVDGLLWPGGYLVLLGMVALAALAAGRVAANRSLMPLERDLPEVANLGRVPGAAALLSGVEHRLPSWAAATGWLRGWYQTVLVLAERELGERPVWLWLALTAAAGWMLAELTHL